MVVMVRVVVMAEQDRSPGVENRVSARSQSSEARHRLGADLTTWTRSLDHPEI
jgi:hypothetical protein